MKQNKLITIFIDAQVAMSQCCSRESLPHQPLYHTMGRCVKTVFLFGTEKTESSLFGRSISVFASPSSEDVLVLIAVTARAGWQRRLTLGSHGGGFPWRRISRSWRHLQGCKRSLFNTTDVKKRAKSSKKTYSARQQLAVVESVMVTASDESQTERCWRVTETIGSWAV